MEFVVVQEEVNGFIFNEGDDRGIGNDVYDAVQSSVYHPLHQTFFWATRVRLMLDTPKASHGL